MASDASDVFEKPAKKKRGFRQRYSKDYYSLDDEAGFDSAALIPFVFMAVLTFMVLYLCWPPPHMWRYVGRFCCVYV